MKPRLRPAVVSALPVGKKYGFGRGFDSFKQVRRAKEYKDKGGPGILVTEKAKKWLKNAIKMQRVSGGKKRFFLWVHYFDPHLPYRCDDSIYRELGIPRQVVTNKTASQTPRDQLDRGYRADVFEADKHIGALLEQLKTPGGDTGTIVAVAAGHGEYLGEKGMVDHHQFLVSVQEGNTKLIRSIINPRRNLLFDLAADPSEEKNRVFKDGKLYKHLGTILDRHIKKDLPNGLLGGDNIKIDKESIKMLKSLGHIE
ncbi:MAG: sulfatase-like hydrolase/transferase [bacterium]|nr:sulfatase-like hydrolase/transferase [bacterium]